MDGLISIGKIINFHGIAGEARVGYSSAARLESAKKVKVKDRELTIEKLRFHKNFAIVKFAEISDINELSNYKGQSIYLEKEKVQKSLRILSKFTDNKQINIIFYLLAVEELCVCDIACLLNLSMASASHHLPKLANQNILDTRREGKIIYYFIKDEEIRDFFKQLG